MAEEAGGGLRAKIEEVYRSDSRRVLATLIRLLGDFELAEEALHDAFTAALDQWQREGLPANPAASPPRRSAMPSSRRHRPSPSA